MDFPLEFLLLELVTHVPEDALLGKSILKLENNRSGFLRRQYLVVEFFRHCRLCCFLNLLPIFRFLEIGVLILSQIREPSNLFVAPELLIDDQIINSIHELFMHIMQLFILFGYLLLFNL